MSKEIILVDENDIQTGVTNKTEAHEKGLLHRAFSVFIFNSRGELLLQKRAMSKYHSGGLWTNSCCSHPAPGEDTLQSAKMRLKEEMGVSCELEYAFAFLYRAEIGNGIIEHEYDHVYVGYSDAIPDPDPAEVEDWKYVNPIILKDDISQYPEKYTAWFDLCYDKAIGHAKPVV